MRKNHPPPTEPATDSASAARRSRHPLVWLLAVIGLLGLIIVGLVSIALKTEWGASMLWKHAARFAPGQLSGNFVRGTLSEGVTLRNVVYRDDTKELAIDNIAVEWQLSYAPLKLIVRFLHIGTADVTLLPSPPKPSTLPRQITLPVAIDLRDVTARQIVVHRGNDTTAYRDADLQANSDRVRHALQVRNLVTPYGRVKGALRLTGTAPFELGGTVNLNGIYREQPYTVDAQLSGTLQELGVQINATGKDLSGDALIHATPFARVPFRSAKIRIDKLDPNALNSAWPKADIDVRATLMPVDPTASQSQLVVSGPVMITNKHSGALDKGLMPLLSAQAEVKLDTEKQRLSQVKIRLPNNATLEGGGEIRKGNKGEFTLQSEELNLHALHTRLRKTKLAGPIRVKFAGDTQRISLKLADPTFSAIADAELVPQRITLHSAQLNAGPARLDFNGMLRRNAQSAYSITGKLADFDPALFLSSIRQADSKPGKELPIGNVHARINMDFEAKGALRPELSAAIQFDVHESTYADLPMTGSGNLHIVGQRVLSSNAQLEIAGNKAVVKGSFGSPSDRLKFHVDAPALTRLGFGLSGLLQLNGEAAGTAARPIVDADFRAENLVLNEHKVALLSGDAHIHGVPRSTSDARLDLHMRARDLKTGEVHLNQLNANVDGTYAAHSINIHGDGQLRGQRLDVTLAAQGRLQENQQGMSWDGVLRILENRGFPQVSMASPLAVSIAPGRIDLGATRLTVAQALIDLKNAHYDGGKIRSEGAFSELNLGHLLALRQQFTGDTAPFNTNLVLDGRWNISLADKANGFVHVDRRHGDISMLGSAGASPLGLTDLSLHADLKGNLVALNANANATRIGNVNGRGRIMLVPVEGHLAFSPDAPITGHVMASIPRLQSIASFAGPGIALDGTVAMDLTVGGTFNGPNVSGSVAGDRLALTLYDQGVRLHDGTARINIKNNIAELTKVEFRGGDGTLRASGRIPLDQANKNLSAVIVADNLQLLASPTGRLTVSGQATAANLNGELLVSGKFTVDRALFKLPESSAPKLDDDVVVIRGQEQGPPRRTAGAPNRPRPAGPFTPHVNVDVDLGKHFRFEGSGADLRLVGTVNIESAPGETPEAFGTVRVAEGTYKAFGTKLAIERGILNFQGPLNNPNLNILAMRREQEVSAGVQITGTVQQPRVLLVSEPNVSEEEKLSWLIFGRSGGSTEQGQAQSAAKGAAVGLLNKLGGARIAKGVGLDELSIGASEYGLTGQQVVNLGKEITDRLFIGYEQSLAGAESVLKLTYELSRQWTVVMRGGTVTGLNVFFNRRFDKIGGRRSKGQNRP